MKTGSNGGALIGWQTLLADLALILFMVTAAAMAAGPSRPAMPASPKLPASAAASEPLALWRAGGSLTLDRWLAMEQPDGRQQLTITAHYRPGGQARAVAAVALLLGQAGAIGQTARVTVTPAAADQLLASLAYDRAPGTARGLLDQTGIPSARTPP